MSDWHRVGQPVVCIDDDFSFWTPAQLRAFPGVRFPVKGKTYTIDDIFTDPYWNRAAFRLREIRNPTIFWTAVGYAFEHGYSAHRFRPVINAERELAKLEALLREVEKREVAEA